MVVNHLHARIPISCFVINSWANISIDLNSFLKHCYPGSEFKSLEFISLKTVGIVRRILGMNMPIADDTGFDSGHISYAEIPAKFRLPGDFYNQMITIDRVVDTEKMVEEVKQAAPVKRKTKGAAPKMAFGR